MKNKKVDVVENVGGKQQYFGVSRWYFYIAIIIIGLLLSVLSEDLTFGPSWLIPVITLILLIPMLISIRKSRHLMTRINGLLITGLVTIGLISSVVFLVNRIITHAGDTAERLFLDAAILWVTNIAVFSVWYWEIDQGGPYLRQINKMQSIDFLFPQAYADSPLWTDWKPEFPDYLFIAFNTSLAFGPTDTMVMSRRAKLLMNTQALISFVIVAVLAAHAIGAL